MALAKRIANGIMAHMSARVPLLELETVLHPTAQDLKLRVSMPGDAFRQMSWYPNNRNPRKKAFWKQFAQSILDENCSVMAISYYFQHLVNQEEINRKDQGRS